MIAWKFLNLFISSKANLKSSQSNAVPAVINQANFCWNLRLQKIISDSFKGTFQAFISEKDDRIRTIVVINIRFNSWHIFKRPKVEKRKIETKYVSFFQKHLF